MQNKIISWNIQRAKIFEINSTLIPLTSKIQAQCSRDSCMDYITIFVDCGAKRFSLYSQHHHTTYTENILLPLFTKRFFLTNQLSDIFHQYLAQLAPISQTSNFNSALLLQTKCLIRQPTKANASLFEIDTNKISDRRTSRLCLNTVNQLRQGAINQ